MCGRQAAPAAHGGAVANGAAARPQPSKRTYTPRRQAPREAALQLDVQVCCSA